MVEELLKVSIIIPVHNAENTLNRCIESVLCQSYKNIECILVENGSSDNSPFLCSMYAEKYKNIISKSIGSKGVSYARNCGLSLATGDIIGFCDADDFLEINAIELVVDEFKKNENVISVFGAFNIGTIDENGILHNTYKGLRNKKISIPKAMELVIVNDSVMGSVWNKYYRTEVLKNMSFDCSLSYCEDMHFNVKVLNSIRSKKKVKVISSKLYCYMENVNSLTHSEDILFDDKDELKYIVALKKIENECKSNKRIKRLCKMKIACFSIDNLKTTNINNIKRQNLFRELNENYLYLVLNFWKNNWKWNLKRILNGIIFLCEDKRRKS